MGAMVGACYALHPEAEAVIEDFRAHIHGSHFVRVRFGWLRKMQRGAPKKNLRTRINEGLMLGRSYMRGSITSFEEYADEISSLVPNKTFKDSRLPFFATALDLTNTREVIFDRGYLRSAVLASAAIPGVFPVVQSGDIIYADGGWMNRIPVNPLLAFGAARVLAIDVSDDPEPEINTKRGPSVLNQANRASQIRLAQLQCTHANAIWRPPVKGLHWADFAQIDEAIEIGAAYAKEHIDQIERLMREPTTLDLKGWQKWLLRTARIDLPRRAHHPITFDIRPIWDVSPADVGS